MKIKLIILPSLVTLNILEIVKKRKSDGLDMWSERKKGGDREEVKGKQVSGWTMKGNGHG